jgi:hypothetical protein
MDRGEDYARSVAFSIMLFGELFLMAEYLSGREMMSLHIMKNHWFASIFIIVACLWLAIAGSGIADEILGISTLDLSILAMCIIVSSLPMIAAEAWKALFQKNNKNRKT